MEGGRKNLDTRIPVSTQGATLRSAPTGPTGADRLPHHIFDDKIDKIDSSLSYLIHYLFSTP
jgi:hypothetical protein